MHTIFPLANMSAVVEGVFSRNLAAAKLSGLNSPYFFQDVVPKTQFESVSTPVLGSSSYKEALSKRLPLATP